MPDFFYELNEIIILAIETRLQYLPSLICIHANLGMLDIVVNIFRVHVRHLINRRLNGIMPLGRSIL